MITTILLERFDALVKFFIKFLTSLSLVLLIYLFDSILFFI